MALKRQVPRDEEDDDPLRDEYDLWYNELIGTPSKVVIGTMFSGIAAAEHAAATIAGLPTKLGAMAELDEAPAKFLSHRFGSTPNVGDVTKKDFVACFKAAAGMHLDLLVGGPPCQSFSTSGKRLGLADPRGQLLTNFARHARELKCAVTILENVEGLRTAADNSFGQFLQAMLGADAEPMMPPGKSKAWPHCGIASSPDTEIAWRMLDARYFDLPQRRVRLYAAITRRDSGVSATDVVFDSQPLRRPFRAIDFAPGCTVWLPRGKGTAVWDGCGPSPPGFDSAAAPDIGDFLDAAPSTNLTPTHKAVRGVAVRAFRADKKRKKPKPLPWMLAAALSDMLDMLPLDATDAEGRAAAGWLAARRSEGPDADRPSGVAVYTMGGGDGRTAPTFTTSSLNSPMRNTPFIVTVDPCDPTRRLLRMLSPAECLRLQGFDAGWLDYSGLSEAAQYFAIGNSMAVPCVGLLLGRAVDAIIRARKFEMGDWDEDREYDDDFEWQEWVEEQEQGGEGK